LAVKNLTLTAQQVSNALGICETAASRKIGEAETLISEALLLASVRLCRTRRPDRVKSAVVERLRTVIGVASQHPNELEPWITRLIDEAFSARPERTQR